jgi:diacylglycerol kinase (ATP)
MENKLSDTNKEFSFTKRAKSFTYAGRGLLIFIRTTHNAWIHTAIFIMAILLGFYFKITNIEWAMLVFAGGLVFISEAFNTAIEIDMNLTSPEHHPYARDTKDVAAGAVLLSAITAVVIGILIFGQYVIAAASCQQYF